MKEGRKEGEGGKVKENRKMKEGEGRKVEEGRLRKEGWKEGIIKEGKIKESRNQ